MTSQIYFRPSDCQGKGVGTRSRRVEKNVLQDIDLCHKKTKTRAGDLAQR